MHRLVKWIQGIGAFSILWSIVRWLWNVVLNHIGNAQTLWDIVKDWPTYLKFSALILGSQWFPLVVAILCLVSWCILSGREKKIPAVTSEHARIVPIGGHLEQKIKQWIDEHGFKHGNVPNGIQVLIPPRFIATIGRQKNRPSWLMLESSILMSEKQRALFAKMSKEKKMSLFRAIRIECGRLEVEHHAHNDGSRRLVCIQKQVPIADLTDSQVINSVNKMHFAADVVMDTIDGLIPPSVASSDNFQEPSKLATTDTTIPLTGLQLRRECDKWIESGHRLRERLVEGG